MIFIFTKFFRVRKMFNRYGKFWNDIKNNNNVYDISKFGHGPQKAPTQGLV